MLAKGMHGGRYNGIHECIWQALCLHGIIANRISLSHQDISLFAGKAAGKYFSIQGTMIEMTPRKMGPFCGRIGCRMAMMRNLNTVNIKLEQDY